MNSPRSYRVKGRPHYYSTKREEYAHVTFDLDADLSSLFNWNTKQVFLYITATYPSSTSSSAPASEAVIWDAIIPAHDAPWHANTYIHPDPKTKSKSSAASKSKAAKKKLGAKAYPPGAKPGILRLPGQKPKYQITDATGKLGGRENATLTLKWNVQPYVGFLTWTNTASIGRWSGLKGGRSASFDFPELASAEGVKKEDLKTEKGGEGYRLHVG